MTRSSRVKTLLGAAACTLCREIRRAARTRASSSWALKGLGRSSSAPASAAAEIDVIKRYSGGGVHPNLSRKYTFGQGKSAEGSTEGILNSNWEGKEK